MIFSESGQTGCLKCPDGQVAEQVGSARCLSCTDKAGFFEEVAGKKCSPCAQHHFKPAGGTSCVVCSGGTFTRGVGSETCESCPGGTYRHPKEFRFRAQSEEFEDRNYSNREDGNFTERESTSSSSQEEEAQAYCRFCSTGRTLDMSDPGCSSDLGEASFALPATAWRLKSSGVKPCPTSPAASSAWTSCACPSGSFVKTNFTAFFPEDRLPVPQVGFKNRNTIQPAIAVARSGVQSGEGTAGVFGGEFLSHARDDRSGDTDTRRRFPERRHHGPYQDKT